MFPIKPLRREIQIDKAITMVSDDPADEQSPKTYRPVDEISRIERLIRVSDLAITPYERKLERGLTLSVDEERMMNAHINTLMKLEMNKAALEAKMQFQKKSNADLARFMQGKGMDREHIITIIGPSPEVLAALDS
jgi:hypothetical protein